MISELKLSVKIRFFFFASIPLFLYLGDMEKFETLTFRERPLITDKWHIHPIGVFNSLTTHGISMYIYFISNGFL